MDYFCKYQSKKKIASGLSWDHALLLTGDLIQEASISDWSAVSRPGLVQLPQHGQGQLGDGLPQWDVQQHRQLHPGRGEVAQNASFQPIIM